mmetsp:Transcript_9439/g.31017  ORF Transcript_9439/g.31017 Transcript_9439/m.31017 type:complete len:220 (+) Transcript_9439:472-1131(+)
MWYRRMICTSRMLCSFFQAKKSTFLSSFFSWYLSFLMAARCPRGERTTEAESVVSRSPTADTRPDQNEGLRSSQLQNYETQKAQSFGPPVPALLLPSRDVASSSVGSEHLVGVALRAHLNQFNSEPAPGRLGRGSNGAGSTGRNGARGALPAREQVRAGLRAPGGPPAPGDCLRHPRGRDGAEGRPGNHVAVRHRDVRRGCHGAGRDSPGAEQPHSPRS